MYVKIQNIINYFYCYIKKLEKIKIKEKLPKMEINLVKIDNNLTKVAKMFIREEILNEE